MQGPGTTVLDGYQRTNQLQDQAGLNQLNQATGALGLVDKIRTAQKAASVDQAYRTAGDDLGALEQALVRAGDVASAEKVGKIRQEREFDIAMKGALSDTGQIDWNKVAVASMRGRNSSGALNAVWKAQQDQAKREQDQQERGALTYLLGDPAPDGVPGELPNTGELPQEGMKPNPPAGRKGALAQYEESDNPAVRRQAGMIRDMLKAKAISAKDAMKAIGALSQADVKVGIEGMKEEGRNSRSEARMEEIAHWDSKRGVGITRGGEAVLPADLPGLPTTGPEAKEPAAIKVDRWRIKTLAESMGMPVSEATQYVLGKGAMQISPSTRLRAAQTLMKLTKEDMVTPVYRTLGEALQAVDQAVGQNTARQGALPPTQDAMPGSLSSGAQSVPGQGQPAPTLPSAPQAPAGPARRRIKFNAQGEQVQ